MNDVDILEFVPIILALGGILMAVAAAYTVGQFHGYAAGKAMVAVLEKQVATDSKLIGVLRETVTAQKRLIYQIEEKTGMKFHE